MRVADNDYIIAKVGFKNMLVLVTSAKDHSGYPETDPDLDTGEKTIKYNPDEIVANLGASPAFGKAFGINIEPFSHTIKHSFWGNINFYRKLDAKESKALKRGFAKAKEALEKEDCFGFLPLTVEIRNKQGKYAGKYVCKTDKKTSETRDRLVISAETLLDPVYNSYIVLHEAGHGVWYRQVDDEIKTRWLKLYTKRIGVTKYKESDLKRVYDGFMDYSGNINDYVKEMASDEDVLLIKEVLSYMFKKRRLDRHDILLLSESHSSMVLENWPTVAELTEAKADVSEYSCVNVREFFAECFAFYMGGKTLPRDVMKAMKNTLKLLDRG